MIKQYLRKKVKISWGIFNSYIRKGGNNYNAIEWWDKRFYTDGVSDRKTMDPQKSPYSARYHYNSVEMQILKHLYNKNTSINQSRVLDIGSGSGHWIDFFRSLGSSKTIGIDVSLSSVDFLKNKYRNNSNVTIHHGKVSEILEKLNTKFDIAIAIGIMFHIVDDSEWTNTIHAVAKSLRKDGLFIVGGHFGYLDGLNVQIDENGQFNKRLRSKRHWKKELRQVGFSDIYCYSNNAYLWIKDPLPENNILIARK